MSQKAMVFIDGGWLYRNRNVIFSRLGEVGGFEIDYKKMPKILCEDVANILDEDISLVRTCYFGTIPSPRSNFNSAKQVSFYDFLEKGCGYETEIHEVNLETEIPRSDEMWIKVALTSSLLGYASQNSTFDIAILLSDDVEYAPALRQVRKMGKRVQVVGTHPVADGKNTAPTLFLKSRVNDFPPCYIEDHAEALRLVRETLKRTCRQCGREEETTWAGPEFFCSHCRGKHRVN